MNNAIDSTAVHCIKISVRPELVDGLQLRSWWFDKFTTKVGEDAFVGTHTALVAPVSVGDRAFTAAGAVITKDVPDHALMIGVPARRSGWMCRCGVRLDGVGDVACSACGSRYRIADAACAPLA